MCLGDYIDRHALKNDWHLCWHDGKGNVYYEVDHAPAANVAEVRYGEWVYDPDGCDWGIGAWRCSLCSAKNDNLGISRDINPYLFVGSKYCPHCGATMRKGGSNDEVR